MTEFYNGDLKSEHFPARFLTWLQYLLRNVGRLLLNTEKIKSNGAGSPVAHTDTDMQTNTPEARDHLGKANDLLDAVGDQVGQVRQHGQLVVVLAGVRTPRPVLVHHQQVGEVHLGVHRLWGRRVEGGEVRRRGEGREVRGGERRRGERGGGEERKRIRVERMGRRREVEEEEEERRKEERWMERKPMRNRGVITNVTNSLSHSQT